MIATENRKAGPYDGNGVTTSFPFYFKVFEDNDLLVILTDAAGVESTAVLSSDYSVTLNPNQDDAPGGAVLMTLAPLAATKVTITSDLEEIQPMVLTNKGGFYPTVLNDSADRTIILIQQLAEKIARAVLSPISDPASAGLMLPPVDQRAGLFLSFDLDGNIIATGGTGADSALRTDLAGPTGDELMRFVALGANSITQSIGDKARQGDISVVDKGGVAGGNATDNTTAFARAYASASAEGRDVYLPKGVFQVNGSITALDNVRLYGPGTIQQTANEIETIILGNNTPIEGIRLIGKGGTVSVDPTKNCAIFGNGKTDVSVRNCQISGFEGGGVHLRGCKDIMITGNRMWANLWNNLTELSSSGDITIYSLAAAGRIVITGNQLYSDMSQSITLNVLGLDADSVVANNIILTLTDDRTALKSAGTLRSRHGILISYNGQAASPMSRCAITGNVIGNKLLTGVYGNTTDGNSGGGAITGNIIYKAGLIGANSLAGGIHLFAGISGWSIVGNVVLDYGDTANGAITINGGVVGGVAGPIRVANNIVRNAAGASYFLNGRIRDWDITGNESYGATGADFAITFIGGAGETEIGGLRLTGNRTVRSNTSVSSIEVSASGGVVPRRCFISDNDFRGVDTTTNVATNTGIRFQTVSLATVSFAVERNAFRRFRHGIYVSGYFTAATRYTDVCFDYNVFDDVAQAFVFALSATTNSTVPCEGNRFMAVGAKFGVGGLGGNICGYEVRRLGVLFETPSNGKPTTGSWAQGDRAAFTAPAAAGPPGAVCTAAGTPGTWKNMAALEA